MNNTTKRARHDQEKRSALTADELPKLSLPVDSSANCTMEIDGSLTDKTSES